MFHRSKNCWLHFLKLWDIGIFSIWITLHTILFYFNNVNLNQYYFVIFHLSKLSWAHFFIIFLTHREDWKPVLTINSIIYGLQYLFLVSICGKEVWNSVTKTRALFSCLIWAGRFNVRLTGRNDTISKVWCAPEESVVF